MWGLQPQENQLCCALVLISKSENDITTQLIGRGWQFSEHYTQSDSKLMCISQAGPWFPSVFPECLLFKEKLMQDSANSYIITLIIIIIVVIIIILLLLIINYY